MAVKVLCPSCKWRMRVPEEFAGRRVTCPHCEGTVRVPMLEDLLQEAAERAASEEPAESETDNWPATPSARLGVVAMALGLVSVLLLCVPYIGYASFGLSTIGLMLGLWGLVRSLGEDASKDNRPLASGVQVPYLLGNRPLSFPLAGAATCLLALALALFPFLID